METSIERDCHDASDSKSSGSELRRIGLSVDLNLPLPVIVSGEDCQHFSIRQYVAEMKKKDMKICSPFGSISNSSEQLSSLEVPELKRCWCANYTHKIADGSVGNIIGLPYLGLRKGTDQTSKGGDANLAENSLGDLREDIANDPKLHKTPKVRLMTELLSGKVNLGSSSRTAELFSTNIMPMELDTIVAPMDMGIKISQKKRNMFQKNDCRFGMNNLDGESVKRLKEFNQNEKVVRSSMENVITNSCPGDNGYDREQCCLQNGSKNVKIKHKSKKDSGVSRRKHNQQAQVFSGCYLQIPLKGKNSGIGTNGSSANILIQSSHASPSIEKLECHLRNSNKSLHTEKDSDLSKLLEDTHASSHINVVQDKNLQRESLSKGEDVVQISIGMEMVTSQQENELYLKEKLGQTLSKFTGAKKHVKKDAIQRKSIPYWPFTILKGNKSCDPLKANGVESSQSLQKGVIPIARQPIVVQSDQSRRDGFINLNHRQDNYISPNPLQRKNHQIQKLVETPRSSNKINLNKIQDHSYVTIPQINQRPIKVRERGPSTYVPPMDNMEMFRNRHERSHPRIQNGVLSWIDPGSTNFNPFYTNAGFLRGSTAMMQVKEQPIKLSNSVQVSSPVPIGRRLQNVERSNPVRFSIAQNTTFRPYNLHENHKREQVFLDSIQKGKTISDLKSVNSMRAENMRTKGIYNGVFLPHHQLKESSGAYMGGFTEAQSSRQHVSYYNDQDVSLRSQEKKRKAHALEELGRRKLQQFASSSGLQNTSRNSSPKLDLMQEDNIFKTLDMGGYSTPATVLPVISILKKDPPCLFNQNTADIIDIDNERYFRTAEDQRIRDTSSLRKKSRVDVKLDGRQSQRRKERSGRMPVVGLKS